MAGTPNPLFYTTDAKVIDPKTGLPWQKANGYEPMALPHVLTFSSIIGSAWRAYYHGQQDDAIRNDPEFAIAMRRDPLLMAMLQERKHATISRKWHIEVNDPKDPAQKAMANGLKMLVDRIPRKRQMFSYLLEAIWFGRYASQLDYRAEEMLLPSLQNPDERVRVKVPVVRAHEPVLGDKIGYLYDGTPYVQIYSPRAIEIPNAAIVATTASRALALSGSWRSKFVIHMHESLDASYWQGEQAGSIYGIGVRHVLYWLAWLKRELLANILTYAERTGMGLRIWYYQAGNPQSKEAVQRAAENQTDRTNILVPRSVNQMGKSPEAVEFVDSGSTVATLLLEILQHFDAEMERYVIGQSLSSGTEGAGLGGTGVAALHASTKFNLVEYDAENLGETLTIDLVRKIAGWVYPASLVDEGNPRFAFDVAPPSPTEILSAIAAASALGVTFEEESVRSITGQPAPQDGDKVIGAVQLQTDMMKAQQKSQMEAQQQMAAMGGGQPGQPGAGGAMVPAGQPQAPTDEDFANILAQAGG